MREQEFRARDKKVRKMTRDGLVEKNLADGTQRRVSRRTAEVSFKPAGQEEMEAGRRAGSRLPDGREKAHKKTGQPAAGDFLAEEKETEFDQENTVSMRDAADKPLLSGRDMIHARPRIRKGRKKRRPGRKKYYPGTETGKRIWEEDRAGIKEESTGREPGRRQAERGQEKRKSRKGPERKPSSRLHYSREEVLPEERAAGKPGENKKEGAAGGRKKDVQGGGREAGQQKEYRARKRVEAARKRVERAKAGIPVRRRLRLRHYYGEHYGKLRYRLRFEKEELPEDREKPLAQTAGKMTTHAVSGKAHQKIREVEKENVGVEAGHKAESAAESWMARQAGRTQRQSGREPYRRLERAQRRLAEREAGLAYRRLLNEHPELKKKALARWMQKRRLKRRYAQAAREAAEELKHSANVLSSIGGAVRSLARKMAGRKGFFLAAAAGILILAVFGSLFSSFTAMLQGLETAVISACYVADDREINESELLYTELETDLAEKIRRTEEDFPDFDEYLYNIGEIGHNPYELMGYLSAAFDAFRFEEVEAEIRRIFELQYELVREEVIETRTYTDEDGLEQEEEWRVLKTTLLVRPLSEIIAGSLHTGDEKERYGVYMQTCGGRQCYGNPFDFPWAGYVTSPYGYRLHPASGDKNLHRGIDIGAAEGTPVRAVQDGIVLSAGEADGYGLCVVVEGQDGYQSRYAHCSALSVHAGQEVKQGDIVGRVGSTGSSTGPHLHLEVTHNGAHLNPYYFVDNGGLGYTAGGGTAAGPDLSGNAGAPMGEEQFAALLAEAEKYLGFPYVWGGSSPETSFDCSGYVSYVLGASDTKEVGRQTAQGLYRLSEPVPREELSPGDLVFFTGTYSTASPVSHVGIYVGGGRMIHAGDPISYADITGQYWSSHYFCGGRLS